MHRLNKQSGFVLITVMLLISIVSYWVLLSNEKSESAWRMSHHHWQSLQVSQVINEALLKAKNDLSACLMNPPPKDAVKEKAWWQANACHGSFESYDNYYVSELLQKNQDDVYYRVTAFASIGIINHVFQVVYWQHGNVVEQVSWRELF